MTETAPTSDEKSVPASEPSGPAPTAAPDAPRARMNLVGLLALLVTVELAMGRIFLKLLPADAAEGPSPLFLRALTGVHRFVGHLAAVLAWFVLAAALIVITRRTYYRASTRFSLVFVGSVLTALVGIGLVAKIPGALLLHLYLSFFFVAASAWMALLASRVPASLRLGLSLILLPAGAHYLIAINDRFATFLGWERRGDWLPYVDGALLLGIALGTVLLRPRRTRVAFALGLGVTLAAATAMLVQTHWDLAHRVAQHGFGLELPLNPIVSLGYAVGFGAALFLISLHLNGDDREQLRGYGLLLLVANGLQLHWPSQLAIAAIGILCLLESVARPDGEVYRAEEIEELLRYGGAAIGAGSVSMSGTADDQTARVVGQLETGALVEVLLRWRHGMLDDLTVTIASAPPRDPPFSLEHIDSDDLGPRADGPRVLLDDLDLDRHFLVFDRRSVGAHLFDDTTRGQILSLCRGWLGVWPQRGLRYRANALPRSATALSDTLLMLGGLWRRVA